MIRIAYIIEGLYNSGGMERVVSQKANWLAKRKDFDVTIITFAQGCAQNDYFTLNNNVKRIFLSSAFQCDVKNSLKSDLNICLNKYKFDICISTYGREFKVLPGISDGSKKIVEFHFAYDINKQWMANVCGTLKTEIIGNLKTRLMVRQAKKFEKIVCLTKADERRWRSDKVVQIYNPITVAPETVSDCSSKVVVAIGRMDKQKGFDYLIDCWKFIEDMYPDWQLKIYGGGDATVYNKQIADLHLKNAAICGITHDVPNALKKSSIYVLSSRYEGFSLTICEAMSCGLPIVTFDCPSGPAELVAHGKNGYIVDNVGDITQMSQYISDLIENEERRKEFGKNSVLMSKNYHIGSIMGKWVHLFEELLTAKAR